MLTNNRISLNPRHALVDALVATLPDHNEMLFNPYVNHCLYDAETNGPQRRRERLAMHLDCDARYILVGEAPGYRGCRYSGVGFSSERLIMEGAIPRLAPESSRLTTLRRPLAEPSATTVWHTLYNLKIADSTILWNAIQMHPHLIGAPHTNRTPTKDEVKCGRRALELLRDAYPGAKIISVGNKATGLLEKLDVEIFAVVRHPSYGGAPEFVAGMQAAVAA